MARSTRSARSPASRIISARAASSGPNDALARPDGGIERSVSAHDREHADGARPQPVVLLASRRALRLECCQIRSEEHTSELQSLMRISYAVFCLKKKKRNKNIKLYNNTAKQQNIKH